MPDYLSFHQLLRENAPPGVSRTIHTTPTPPGKPQFPYMSAYDTSEREKMVNNLIIELKKREQKYNGWIKARPCYRLFDLHLKDPVKVWEEKQQALEFAIEILHKINQQPGPTDKDLQTLKDNQNNQNVKAAFFPKSNCKDLIQKTINLTNEAVPANARMEELLNPRSATASPASSSNSSTSRDSSSERPSAPLAAMQ